MCSTNCGVLFSHDSGWGSFYLGLVFILIQQSGLNLSTEVEYLMVSVVSAIKPG